MSNQFIRTFTPQSWLNISISNKPSYKPSFILFSTGYNSYTPQVSINSDHEGQGEHRNSLDISPSAAARSLLSKLSVRKPSILSISSNNSGNSFFGGSRKNSTSQEELFHRRKHDFASIDNINAKFFLIGDSRHKI